jgi:hypothetical protein
MLSTKRFFSIIALICCLFCTIKIQAQEKKNNWSISTSLTYPIVNIYVLHFNYQPTARHEFTVGPCFQNFRHESFTTNAITLLLGYRHFVWKGLNMDVELYPAYNSIYSHIDKSYYPGWELWSEIKMGYRFPLASDKFYIQPSPGIGFGIFRTNRPPRFGEEIETPIFVPQIIMGMKIG